MTESVSKWKVCSHSQVFECDDLDWKCTCLFSTSTHLSCHHLMHIAHKGHKFKMLPAIAIRESWSTLAALNATESLAASADMLRLIVRMSKLRLPKVRLSEESSGERNTRPAPTSAKQVVYVRLRRQERANQVVLSSTEKYSFAKAMVEPLLEHLSSLGSAAFYEGLQAWKRTVEEGLRRGESMVGVRVASNTNENEDGEDKYMASAMDPADAMETAKLMEDLENAHADGVTDGTSSSDEVESTQLSGVVSELTSETAKHEGSDPQDEVPLPPRQVDIINVPKSLRRNRSRSTPTQLRQKKLSPGISRLVVHKYPSGITVRLDDLVMWARNTPDMKYVSSMLDKYPVQLDDAYLRSRVIECQWEAMRSTDYMHPFVIPVDLTRSMEAAISTAKAEQREPDKLDAVLKQQGIVLDIAASIDPKIWKFSSRYVNALAAFYSVKAKVRSWVTDRKWLERSWNKLDSDMDLFAKETSTWGVTRGTVHNRHQTLANEVISKFMGCRLRSEFATRCDKMTIRVGEMIGSVCRGWLNDSSIEFCVTDIASSTGTCYVVSSLLSSIGWPTTPRVPLRDYKFIVHPVNLSANHWGVIIIRLEATNGEVRARTHMYEPLIDSSYHDEMKTIWEGVESEQKEGLRGFVERWHKSSLPETLLIIEPVTWVDGPQQPDYSSCGVLVVAHIHSVVAGNEDLHVYKITQSDVDAMRLRMLWLMLFKSHERRLSKGDATKAVEVDQRLQNELK